MAAGVVVVGHQMLIEQQAQGLVAAMWELEELVPWREKEQQMQA